MSTPELNPDQLSDHDKQMLAVAEGGDPNDPSEVNLPSEQNKEAEGDKEKDTKSDFELPEGFESYEELIEAAKKSREAEADADDKDKETDGTGEGDENADDQKNAEEEEGLTEAEAELREMKVYQEVGSKEEYGKMIQFAEQSLTPEQAEIYDAAVNGADSNVAMFAVQGLKALFELNEMKNFGQEGQMTQAASGGLGVTQGYTTQSEMMADMADPRYTTDERFNAQVAQKLALTNF
ncbi:hypothetical protein [Amphritea sp. HPY]|uniref:hypothetical protein n=1 Tax=Amphritea sp. HPY TaxID=3421652 RepID=UPI003D7C3D14